MRRWLMLGLTAVLLAACARADVAVTLRAAARIDAGSTLTIGDVAEVSGNAAIASLPLDADTAAPGRIMIRLADIQRALDSWGLGRAGATIRGDTCTVIVRQPAASAPHERKHPVITHTDAAPSGLTVRSHIRAAIERTLGVAGGSLRLQFDPADTETVDRPTAGLAVDVQTSGLGRRTPIRVTLYQQDGSIEVVRVRVNVHVLREVARVGRPLPRGATIGPDDVAVTSEWLAPDEPHVEPSQAVGQRLRRAADVGDRLTDANVEPPIVIERGDIVMVHVVSGAVILRQESRALESGRVGQRIALEPMVGGRSFQAAVEGPGRAVIMTPPRIRPEDV